MNKKHKSNSFNSVWKKHLRPSLVDAKCTEKHIDEVQRHLNRWNEFWLANSKLPKLTKCKRRHLETWRRHLLDLGKYSNRSINKHLGSIRSILVAADKHGILKRRPKLEQLPELSSNESRKIYFRDEQIDALMHNTGSLTWPPKEITGVKTSTWWQCALVLYRIYGFRTQELLAYESKKKPLVWSNLAFASESPNPVSELVNELGWLFYVPPKTAKKKPSPIYLPLTRHARAAINLLASAGIEQSGPLFRMPRSQDAFMKQWYVWLKSAGVKPKIETAQFTPYSLRKTCATHLSRHCRGLATAVCRWGSDKSEAQVAIEHYINDDQLILRLLDAPMPSSFDTLLVPRDRARAA